MVRNIVAEQRHVQTQEQHEKEEREKNIIIFKSKEKEQDNVEIRKEKDLEIAEKLIHQIDRDEITIKSVFRLGSFDSKKTMMESVDL